MLAIPYPGNVAPDTPFLLAWHFPVVPTFGLFITGVAYGWAVYRLRKTHGTSWPGWYTAAFYAGLLALSAALLGPLDTFKDDAFSVHMGQHLVLMLVAAPLLLLGRPVQLALRALPRQTRRRLLRLEVGNRSPWRLLAFLMLPITAAALYNGNMAVWHIPSLYEVALENEVLHSVVHAAFFGTALLFWWPIIDPVPRQRRYSTAVTLIQLAIAMFVGKIVGGVMVFSPSVIYPSYEFANNPWGYSAVADQHFGGAILLIGGLVVYATLFFVLLAKALIAADKQQAAKERRASARRRTRQPAQ